MEEVKIWQWNKKYENPALDGTFWSIVIEQSGKSSHKLLVEGKNSYPADTDVTQASSSVEPGKVFKKYLTAVQALLGKLSFQ
jgi:hypothetical protein